MNRFFTEKEVRQKLQDRQFGMGYHAKQRLVDSGIGEVLPIVRLMAKEGEYTTGFNSQGHYGQLDCRIAGTDYRIVVGRNRHNTEWLYIITAFKVEPFIQQGSMFHKFSDRELVYDNFASAA